MFRLQDTSAQRDIDAGPQRLKMMIVRSTDLNRQSRWERSSTLSLSGSQGRTQKTIRKGLQEAVKEYLQAPPASTLPHSEFPTAGPSQLSLSTHFEMGLHQMSEVVMVMSEMALSVQGSRESPVKNMWKDLKKGGTTTTNYPWTGYWFNSEVYFGHPNVPTL